MKLTKIILVVLIILGFLTPSQSVRADMAPPPAPGLGGLRPFQYQPTEVQMVYERVELTIAPSTDTSEPEWAQEYINVTAWFVLHNTGSKDEEMKAAFPLDSLTLCDENIDSPSSYGIGSYFIIPESFKVVAGGRETQTQVTEIEGIDCVGWATFDIKFPAQKDVLVRIDYSMQTDGRGHDLILQYILETGAGWKGSIKQAYVIFRFPYLITNGNIDTAGTTPGYQVLHNEVFWSYQNLEPTPNDNIIVSFFEPRAWARIQALEEQVAKTPTDIDTWLKLFDEYAIGTPYDTDYVSASFERAIEFHPANADLYAKYAEYLVPNCCYRLGRGDAPFPAGGREYAQRRVIPLINHSLALDPQNKIALEVLGTVQYAFPDIIYTPPATIPPTATSLFTTTPSVTPTVTLTPIPSETPIVVTVVHTKLVSPPTSVPEPDLMVTSTPTPIAIPNENQNSMDISRIIFGILLGFIAGIGAGAFWSKRTRK